ncbi:MAG: type II toxin-antitoxin system RelE/ParE family toxin [Synergistaceae bacterium]|nr:type II toxin-antitoxin system RelE/ParE family toxin [Synergistaceae bacterium]
MQDFEVIFYRKENGEEPVKDFLTNLDPKMRAKIARAISRLEKNGTELREPFSKHLEDGIFELRVTFSSNISRVLYFFFIGHTAILTNGFIKKTQKTPRSEIEKAKRYRDDYTHRRNKNNGN